jgi:hypothetical protein
MNKHTNHVLFYFSGALIIIMFVSYIGGRYNKIRWIAGGSVIMAVGSFIFIIPHLAVKYNYGK